MQPETALSNIEAASSATGARRRRALAIGLAYLAFVSLGLPDGLLGVAWPSVRATFGLPLDALGPLLVLFTVGYLIASFLSGWLLSRLSVGALLALSCLATAVSLLGYAVAPRWWAMVALAAMAGLGAGAIDAGLNSYAARNFSALTVNWLHACYGVGAAAGPVLMTGLLMAGQPWQSGYAIVGFGQMALALAFGLTLKLWQAGAEARAEAEVTARPSASNRETLRLPAVWLGVAAFFVYTGLEAAAGTWAYSLFTESRHIPMGAAGQWVSAYWGALMAGRVLSGVLVSVMTPRLLLRLSLLVLTAGAALLWLNVTDLTGCLGLALLGLGAAAVFPTLIAETPKRLGEAHTANAVGYQIAAAVLGQSLLPALVGVLAGRMGLEIVGPALLVTACVLAGINEAMHALAAGAPQNSRRAGISPTPGGILHSERRGDVE